MSKPYDIALGKVQHFHGRQWVACVTPQEALELLNAGAVPTSTMYSRESWVKKRAEGVSGLYWFYFTMHTNSKLAKAVGERQ